MKCTNCGALLKTGCVYCSVCGKEAQFVPDYNMEEDYLKELIQKENRKKKITNPHKNHKKKQPSKESEQVKNRRGLYLGVVAVVVAFIAVFIAGVYVVKSRSYDGRMERAEKSYSRKEYEKAMSFAKQALEQRDQDVQANLMLGKCSLAKGDLKQAKQYLEEAIAIDHDSEETCKLLIQLYEEEQDYEAIVKLYSQVEKESVKELFTDYILEPPVITPEGGEWDEYPEIAIEAKKGIETYYTTDGSDPKSNGTVYEEPFQIKEEGIHRVRAIGVDQRGIYSEKVEETYEVTLSVPDLPTASPNSGTYSQPTAITIDVPSGCRAYYSWNGTPGRNTEQYTGPIEMIPGNNVLSIILVDKNGQTSGIQKYNYIYMP